MRYLVLWQRPPTASQLLIISVLWWANYSLTPAIHGFLMTIDSAVSIFTFYAVYAVIASLRSRFHSTVSLLPKKLPPCLLFTSIPDLYCTQILETERKSAELYTDTRAPAFSVGLRRSPPNWHRWTHSYCHWVVWIAFSVLLECFLRGRNDIHRRFLFFLFRNLNCPYNSCPAPRIL